MPCNCDVRDFYKFEFFKFENFDKFPPEWVERIHELAGEIGRRIYPMGEVIRFKGSYSFTLDGKVIGKLAPEYPPEPRFMVGFSTTMQCPDVFAGRLGRREPYELGPSKEPFLMVACDLDTQAGDISDVMREFFLANVSNEGRRTDRTEGRRVDERVYTIPNLAKRDATQLSLFPSHAAETLKELGVSMKHVEMWMAAGWLSYNPLVEGSLTDAKEAELRFVAGIASSGLSYESLCDALAMLEKPYAYDVHNVVWEFGRRRWRYIPAEAERLIEDRLDELTEEDIEGYISKRLEDGDTCALESLLESLQCALGEEPEE